MTEGSLVAVTAKLNSKSKTESKDLILGTLIYLIGKRVMVLLPDGYIFHGSDRDVAPYAEQQ